MNERHNGMLRPFLPKGTSIEKYSAEQVLAFADEMNSHPRKRLGYRTPEELFDIFLDRIYAAWADSSLATRVSNLNLQFANIFLFYDNNAVVFQLNDYKEEVQITPITKEIDNSSAISLSNEFDIVNCIPTEQIQVVPSTIVLGAVLFACNLFRSLLYCILNFPISSLHIFTE